MLVEVEGREVVPLQHWTRPGSSSSRPDLAAPEHVMESLLDSQNDDRMSHGDGALMRTSLPDRGGVLFPLRAFESSLDESVISMC